MSGRRVDVDQGRNYYNYGRFGHITRHCKNRRMVEQVRKISYQNNNQNLKEKESLIVLD